MTIRHLSRRTGSAWQAQWGCTPTGLPQMQLDPAVTDLFAFTYDSFMLEGYEAQPNIPAPIAV